MRRLFRLSLALLAFGLLATLSRAQSQGPEGSKIRIEGAWARRAPMLKDEAKGGPTAGSGNGAVYLTIVNSGSAADDLVAASTDAARTVELHESYEESGMMMMRPAAKLGIPAGAKLELKPGAYHIMLLDLKRDLKVDQVINLTLVFKKAGQIPLQAKVK